MECLNLLKLDVLMVPLQYV